MKKFILIVTTTLITAIFLVGCTAEPETEVVTEEKEVKIEVGVMDQDRVWTESEQAANYQEKLNNKIEDIQEEYKQQVEGLEEQEQLEKHQQTYEEINQLQDDLRDQFIAEIEQVVKEIAVEEELDMILDQQDVRYGGVDITEQVIEKLQ
ncbi:OmpH family outer membrane protein [Natroniella sulfidigena]|uniref:OmpH family outer membrane protein n=1 Tax=Natroniella sulfidigena TaxID=723921 RepID=UPI00200AEFA8|nr:OmpH family outer membrane protein [Natroniella sulfidigena]MCK8816373.1 OmpH family outer membrane protein [Natroniella sulfidigena]